MIRDPSDGSVREPQQSETVEQLQAEVARHPDAGFSDKDREAVRALAGPVIDPTTSGLQTGSSKPENLARLEKAREWIRDYRAGKFKLKETENG
jgi:hypothetical protein